MEGAEDEDKRYECCYDVRRRRQPTANCTHRIQVIALKKRMELYEVELHAMRKKAVYCQK